MKTQTFYYVHIPHQDTKTQRWDFREDPYEFTEVTWHGPFESRQEALDYIESTGYSRMAFSPKVVEMELPIYG